ncbi:unnamed protein product [Cladocopium goreaui]|uniref:Uncharacterized protein n=1 Tax=Cladocopium goreaui TaxID=2562237 RepID=A0A9P1FP64_9DINO|nr:unnamed protein product [Cladocopium goreaui]
MEQLLLKAQQVGVMLSNEALTSLAQLPPEHSVELLEFVLDRAQDLRHVSNYIVGTVARGFKSQKGTKRGGESQEAVQRYCKHLQENGIQLDPSAHQALGNIPANDAARVPSLRQTWHADKDSLLTFRGWDSVRSAYICGSAADRVWNSLIDAPLREPMEARIPIGHLKASCLEMLFIA